VAAEGASQRAAAPEREYHTDGGTGPCSARTA
jgi:hypothetical protein